MNICGYKHPELIPGHLYQNDSVVFGDEIYMYCKFSGLLVALNDGEEWVNNSDEPFGRGAQWTDVTDQYCLKKVN